MDVDLLLDTLEDAGSDPTIVSGGDEIILTCPLCSDHKPRLYVSAKSGLWICHHCQERGNLYALLRQVCELTPEQASLIGYRCLKHNRPSVRLEDEEERPEIKLPAEYVPSDGKRDIAARYLSYRGLRGDLAPQYGIGYCLKGTYAGRLIVPVRTQGELLTFVARAFSPNVEKKVLMPKGSRSARALFNIDNVEPPTCILVEGVFDALRLPNFAIATLGAHLSRYQRRLLMRAGFMDVIVMRDGDEEGQAAAKKEAYELVAAGANASIATLPDGVDPASATNEELQEALDSAMPVDVL